MVDFGPIPAFVHPNISNQVDTPDGFASPSLILPGDPMVSTRRLEVPMLSMADGHRQASRFKPHEFANAYLATVEPCWPGSLILCVHVAGVDYLWTVYREYLGCQVNRKRYPEEAENPGAREGAIWVDPANDGRKRTMPGTRG